MLDEFRHQLDRGLQHGDVLRENEANVGLACRAIGKRLGCRLEGVPCIAERMDPHQRLPPRLGVLDVQLGVAAELERGQDLFKLRRCRPQQRARALDVDAAREVAGGGGNALRQHPQLAGIVDPLFRVFFFQRDDAGGSAAVCKRRSLNDRDQKRDKGGQSSAGLFHGALRSLGASRAGIAGTFGREVCLNCGGILIFS